MPIAESVSPARELKLKPVVMRARPAPTSATDASLDSPDWLKRMTICALAGLLLLIAFKISTGAYYTPRSNVGFSLGVTGSLMMIAMLSYPLRKRIRWMQRWGALKHWFRWHMVMGIVGPTLVLFHTTFHLRSLNATVALTSMLIVVTSGVIGRFVYTRIHYGLYGVRATLERVQQEFAGQSDEMKSRFHMAPHIEHWLKAYAQTAGLVEPSLITMWWHFFSLRWKRLVCSFRCARELRRVLRKDQYPEFPNGTSEAIGLARRYLREAERIAEFTAYERIFALWHVLHIPLIFLLAASASFHVIAVYMY